MREQIEVLEDHPHARAHAADVRLPVAHEAPLAVAAVADERVPEPDFPLVVILEEIDAAQKRALSRSAGPDDDENLARGHFEIDPAKHVVGAEVLVQIAHLDERRAVHARLPQKRSRC